MTESPLPQKLGRISWEITASGVRDDDRKDPEGHHQGPALFRWRLLPEVPGAEAPEGARNEFLEIHVTSPLQKTTPTGPLRSGLTWPDQALLGSEVASF